MNDKPTGSIASVHSVASVAFASLAAAAGCHASNNATTNADVAVVSAARPAPAPVSVSAASTSADRGSKVTAACEDEAGALARDPDALETVVVVLDAVSGQLLGTAGRRGQVSVPEMSRSAAIEPGSVMKTFTFAAAIDAGLLAEGDRWDDRDDTFLPGAVHDSKAHGSMSSDDVLAFSSNIGALQIFDRVVTRVGPGAFADLLTSLHLADSLDLAHADKARLGRVAIGEDALETPLALAAAFRAVAVDGLYRSPSPEAAPLDQGHPARILRPESVEALRSYLEHAVARADATGHGAAIPGVRVAGKTGTWKDKNLRGFASFVGLLPAQAPRFVLYVGVLTRKEGYSGGTVAAPAFARLAQRLFSEHL